MGHIPGPLELRGRIENVKDGPKAHGILVEGKKERRKLSVLGFSKGKPLLVGYYG